jgi:hypothetical protein
VIGERVWQILADQHLTIDWLSAQSGIKQKRFYHLKWDSPPHVWRREEMEAVARALRMSPSALFGRQAYAATRCTCARHGCGKAASGGRRARSGVAGPQQAAKAAS